MLKKVIAIVTSVLAVISAVLFLNSANAAGLDNATAQLTLDGNTGADTLTVTVSGKDFTSDNVSSLYVYENGGSAVMSLTGGQVTDANGSFTVSGEDLEDGSGLESTALTGATRYTVSFVTAAGDFGAAVVVNGTDDEVTVTATVLPVLKFALEGTTIALGELSSSYASGTQGVEVGTNATAGVTITATSTNGGLSSSAASHVLGLSGNDALYSAEGYQFFSTLGTADSVSGATITNVAATDVDVASEVVTIYTNDKPENFNTGDYDVDFTVQAKTAESTPAASDYTDTITFTVTANF